MLTVLVLHTHCVQASEREGEALQLSLKQALNKANELTQQHHKLQQDQVATLALCNSYAMNYITNNFFSVHCIDLALSCLLRLHVFADKHQHCERRSICDSYGYCNVH